MFSNNILLLLCVCVCSFVEKSSATDKGKGKIVMDVGERSQHNIIEDGVTLHPLQTDGSYLDEIDDDHITKPIEEADMRSAFELINKNNDDGISSKDLKQVFESLGDKVPDEDIELMIHKYKAEDGNKITYEKFKELMTSGRDAVMNKRIFDMIDKDKDGLVNPDDLIEVYDGFGGVPFKIEEAVEFVKLFGDKNLMQMDFKGFQRFLNGGEC